MPLPTFADLAAAIYVDGVEPQKSKVRAWSLSVETALSAALGFALGMANGKLVATVNANVLTIALKTIAGNDPSASDPVYVFFRGAADNDGDFDVITITAATSLTVSAGSTLAALASTPFRLWVVGFNDGGTFRLGVINCYSAGLLYPLQETALVSSTAEGGAGGADSAGVFYTGSAVATKAFQILGFLTWNTGLAAPGSWSAAPDVIQLFGPGVKKPGDVVQSARNATSATATGTTTTPLDDSIPQQSTEGSLFLSQAITPKSQANLLRVRSELFFAGSAAVHAIAALHKDAAEDALVARAVMVPSTDDVVALALQHEMLAAAVTATTFKVHIGQQSAGTIRLNGVSAARLFGGAGFSDLEIREIMT